MIRANSQTGMSAIGSRDLCRRLAIVGLAVAVVGIQGCGWIFKKQRKDMTVNVSFTATDSLNFDGRTPKAVQLKIFVLSNSARFMSGDTRAFFDPTFDEAFLADLYRNDTLKTASVILTPGESRSVELVVPFSKARDSKPSLGVIADFFHPPTGKKERLTLKLRKKSKQTIHITVGKDEIARAGK